MKWLLWIPILLIIITACNPTGRVVEEPDECNVLKGYTTINNCYFEKAISTANNTFCEKITMEPLRESCISEIGIATNNLKICENLGENAKGNCYAKIAINRQDGTICQSIESIYWWDICHYKVGIAKNDEKLCFEMNIDCELTNKCFREIAESKQDENICRWIVGTKEKYGCYKELALMKKDVSVCNRIDNTIWKNGNCIKKLAEETNDASICEMITIAEIKQDCLDKFKD